MTEPWIRGCVVQRIRFNGGLVLNLDDNELVIDVPFHLTLPQTARDAEEAVVIDLEEARQQRSLLHAALLKLNPRERAILVERHLKEEPATLVELSQRYAVSRERIRQIEMRAVEKLQKAIHAKAPLPLARSA